MNPGPVSSAQGQPPPKGLTVDDVIYTLFRHKWLLLAFLALSVVGALAVRLVRPPLYISKQAMVHYVSPSSAATPGKESEGPLPLTPTPRRSSPRNRKSHDPGRRRAGVTKDGAERILALKGGGSNRLAAPGWSLQDLGGPARSFLTPSLSAPGRNGRSA
jgi:hypothetical protein